MTASKTAIEAAAQAAATASRMGGDDILALDVTEPLPFADVFLLVSADSERAVTAIAREIEDDLAALGVKAARREGREAGRWALTDFGDLVVHVFHTEEREYYALERLWRDCPIVELAVDATASEA